MPLRRLQKLRDFAIHQDGAHGAHRTNNTTAADTEAKKPVLNASPAATLAPASTGAINSMQGRGNAAAKHALGRTATIRSVPSFDVFESSPDSKRSGFSSSVNSNNSNNTSGLSAMGSSQYERTPPTVRLKSETMNETPVRWNGNGVRVAEHTPVYDSSMLSESAEPESGQWDSTIGKAGLGKTGRVINKLVSDNDALKRDIKIERLRSEEAKQAAKLIEDKMERMMSDYESQLLESNVTKTLLARKERQVETLTATVDTEKKKATAAQERERSWKKEMEKVKSESTVQVEEATSYAQLMEGRYNAISSHWRDQGDEVKRAVSNMRGDINTIVDERKEDDHKINILRDLCEQQDNNIKEMRREKEEIARNFSEYKQLQEDQLKDIKTKGQRRDIEQEKLLEESREALAKLKWALNVKKNVKGAQ